MNSKAWILAFARMTKARVIPAKAGIHDPRGMDPRLREDDESGRS